MVLFKLFSFPLLLFFFFFLFGRKELEKPDLVFGYCSVSVTKRTYGKLGRRYVLSSSVYRL